jgi:hypothetical protein
MSVLIAQEWLRTFTYKPNWKFEATLDLHRGVYIKVEVLVPNVNNPDVIVPLTTEIAIPNMVFSDTISEDVRKDAFFGTLRMLIDTTELHESDERFKIDGLRRHDPHHDGERVSGGYHFTFDYSKKALHIVPKNKIAYIDQ